MQIKLHSCSEGNFTVKFLPEVIDAKVSWETVAEQKGKEPLSHRGLIKIYMEQVITKVYLMSSLIKLFKKPGQEQISHVLENKKREREH